MAKSFRISNESGIETTSTNVLALFEKIKSQFGNDVAIDALDWMWYASKGDVYEYQNLVVEVL